MMKNKKSLEETIKELHKKYKNTISPLSEQYNKNNKNVNFVPQQKTANLDPRNSLLDNFSPPKNSKFF
jgi:hypothetical protein